MDRRVVLVSAGEATVERRVLRPGREVWKLGVLPPIELRRMYEAADLGVVPSVSEEVFAVAAVEMMASGLPVIASRAGGLPEVLDDGVNGRLVDIPNGVESWSEAIAGLLADVEERARLGAAARATALDRYSLERAQQNWTHVLGQLMAGDA
jgi:spore coat protein SA